MQLLLRLLNNIDIIITMIKGFLLTILVGFTQFIAAQNNPIELNEVTSEGKITIEAKNSSDQAIDLTLSFTLQGMESSNGKVVTKTVPAHGTTTMSVLSRKGGPASYSYKSSYRMSQIMDDATAMPEEPLDDVKNYKSQDVTLDIPEKGIVVFSKRGCGRCTYTTKYFDEKGVPYKELNISDDKKTSDFFWSTLRKNGFANGSVQTPVIVVDGKVNYKIRDLKGFLEETAKSHKK